MRTPVFEGVGPDSLVIDWQAANYRPRLGSYTLERSHEADDPVRERAGQTVVATARSLQPVFFDEPLDKSINLPTLTRAQFIGNILRQATSTISIPIRLINKLSTFSDAQNGAPIWRASL